MVPAMKRVPISLTLVSLVLAIPLGLMSACASEVPPTVTMSPVAPIIRSEGIYIIAAQMRDPVKESLIQAGLKPVDRPATSGYALEVRVGKSRSSGDCGSVRNVAYILTAARSRVMVIKGRGPTGSCPENIFNGMSKALASHSTQ